MITFKNSYTCPYSCPAKVTFLLKTCLNVMFLRCRLISVFELFRSDCITLYKMTSHEQQLEDPLSETMALYICQDNRHVNTRPDSSLLFVVSWNDSRYLRYSRSFVQQYKGWLRVGKGMLNLVLIYRLTFQKCLTEHQYLEKETPKKQVKYIEIKQFENVLTTEKNISQEILKIIPQKKPKTFLDTP